MIENWPILSILIFLPIFGALLILLIPNKVNQEGEILKNTINNIISAQNQLSYTKLE